MKKRKRVTRKLKQLDLSILVKTESDWFIISMYEALDEAIINHQLPNTFTKLLKAIFFLNVFVFVATLFRIIFTVEAAGVYDTWKW